MLRESTPEGSRIRVGFLGAAAVTALVGVIATASGLHGSADDTATSASAPREMTMEDLIAQTGDAADATGSLPVPAEPSPADAPPAEAATPTDPARGSVTKLPIPRFVSIKPDRVNVRVGPTRQQNVAFTFQRAGVPVEVTAEFENWRRIRDYEGAEGWVMQSMLSGKRTAIVSPWAKSTNVPLYRSADSGSTPLAMLEPGVTATVEACGSDWCRIEGDRFNGWVEQNRLWGVYPGEDVEN